MDRNHRLHLAFLTTAAALLACLPLLGESAPARRALLIGIDDYRHVPDLAGTVNDVELMRSVLIGKFDFPPENVRVLTDRDATREAILEAIRAHLIEPAEADDVVVLHYSGHGSQMRDTSGDEIDGWDETLVPHDSRARGVFDISDDELNALLAELGTITDNVTLIFDSCHSGSATRAGSRVRQVARDERRPPESETRGASEGAEALRPPGADYVLVSGARADELANETRIGGRSYGAMTHALATALQSAGTDMTWRDVLEPVRGAVTARYPSQHPQLEGARMDSMVFGVERYVARPYILVEPANGDTLRVDAGAVQGLTPGTRLAVHAPGTRDFSGAPVANAEIARVEPTSAVAKLIDGGEVAPSSRAVIESRRYGDTTLAVWADPRDRSRAMRNLRRTLEEDEAVTLVKRETQATLRVSRTDGKIFIESADRVSLSPPVEESGEDAVEHVARQVAEWASWFALLGLDNPGPGLDVDFTLRRGDDPPGAVQPSEVAVGANLTYRLVNRSAAKIYPTVLDLSTDGSIAVLYPRSGAEEPLPPGRMLEETIETFLPEGRDRVTDHLKAIVTTEPINPQIFAQDAIRGASRGPLPDDPLGRLLAETAWGLERGSRPVSLADWTTAARSVDIVRSIPRAHETLRVVLHYDEPVTRGAGARAICEPGEDPRAPDCIEGRVLDGEGRVIEVEPGATRSLRGAAQGYFSPGAAFDEAYRLREEKGAARAEPLFELALQQPQSDPYPSTRSGGGDDEHDPAAAANDLWSLEYVRAPDAWEKLRDVKGKPAGREAAGIVIAHPDTGYRRHPENWTPVEGVRPIRAGDGRNYIDGSDDAFDPLSTTGLKPNPAHGTASSSVIVSPPGCQLEGQSKCVNGVGRGAELVPLRVHTSVVLVNQKRLAEALFDVAEGELAVDTPLVSIAMGGPPSWALWRAVRKAEDAGVLIVSAAGNYVRTVVWPARFPNTIAVAAVNVRCGLWRHSSRGGAVDIAAPGESVWRATVDLENGNADTIGMGKGTTFATGTTAGAAALWLAWHGDDSKLDDLRSSGRVTAAFREAVQRSSWRPGPDATNRPEEAECAADAGWNPRRYGAGIVNASALLDVDLDSLDAAATRAMAGRGLTDLPLYASIYPPETDPALIEMDYRRLFGLEPDDELETRAYLEAELGYHYTTSEDVRSQMDALIAGPRDEQAYALLREALLRQDLSRTLRAALDI